MTGAPSLGLSVQQLVPRARVAPLIADARACSSFQPAAMDFWPSAGGPLSPNGAGSDLNLLNDSLLIDLDDKTLQASDKLSAGGLCGRGPGPRCASGVGAAAVAARCPQADSFPCTFPTVQLLQCLMGGPTAGFGTCFSGGGSGECADGEAVASGSNKREAEAAAGARV